MDFLATPLRRRFLFAALYFSEGAPIGFLWLALPTRLKAAGLPLEQITWLTAILVLPWTFKFAWAPLVDVLRGECWSLRHWIVMSQWTMVLTLLPLLWFDPIRDFPWMAVALVAHAFSAATQDVAIDALCIAETPSNERGQYNGWMQVGMLLGRASLGGGALILAGNIGDQAVVGLLIAAVLGPSFLVMSSNERRCEPVSQARRMKQLARSVRSIAVGRRFWLGMLFGLLGGAAFKSFDVVYGPFLIDRGYSSAEIGWFSAGPMIVFTIVGSIVGGWLADRIERRQFVAISLVVIVLAVTALALVDNLTGQSGGRSLLVLMAVVAFGIGLFTAASYALFMDLTDPRIGASQFSAYMGATNGCESWSTFAIGQIITSTGYATGFLAMSCVSLAAIVLLVWLKPPAAAGVV